MSKSIEATFKKEGVYKEGDALMANPKELKMGIKVEMEHTKNPKVAREIVLDHLAEDPKYYTHLIEMEKKYVVEKSLMEGDMNTRYALVVIPGEIAPLEKSDHPAELSNVNGKIKSKIPYEGHEERIKFAQMATKRMLESSFPEDEGKNANQSAVDREGREAGGKAPYGKYSTGVSGMGSRAHNNYNFGWRTVIVRPSEIGSGAPESSSKHQPLKVRSPKR